MQTVQWGIIGCGDVTEVKSGPAFNKVANSKLVAVMRRNAEKARDYASRHNVPGWYDDATALINDPQVNAVYVATPPSSHEEHAIAAMQAGKPVYLEKPMSMDAVSARRIAETSRNSGMKLTVAHYRRQLTIFQKVKELISADAVGPIQQVIVQLLHPLHAKGFSPSPEVWRLDPAISGGGIFHDLAPHQLDLLYYFFGKPTELHGTSGNHGGYYAADDMVAGVARFPNNILMTGIWSFIVPEEQVREYCELIGDEGTICFSFFKMDKIVIRRKGKTEELHFEPQQHVQQPMIVKVVDYFLGRGRNPCSAEEGVTVMEMIDAFTRK